MRSKNDYEAVKNGDFDYLWMRHRRMVYQWANKNAAILLEDHDDLIAEGMHVVWDWMQRVDLNRVKDPETWSMSQRVYFGLKHLRRRLKSRRVLAVREKTIRADPAYSGKILQRENYVPSQPSPEEFDSLCYQVGKIEPLRNAYDPVLTAFEEMDRVLWETVSVTLTPLQHEILVMRQLGKKTMEIRRALNLTAFALKKELQTMQDKACETFGASYVKGSGFVAGKA